MNNIIKFKTDSSDTVPPGGGDNDMNERIKNLENNVEIIKGKLIDTDKRFDKLENKIDQLPTKDFLNLSISNGNNSLKVWILSGVIAAPLILITLAKALNFLH